jgi:hypothetical protein
MLSEIQVLKMQPSEALNGLTRKRMNMKRHILLLILFLSLFAGKATGQACSLTSAEGTDDQTICINSELTAITYTMTDAAGGLASGLPAGVNAVFSSGTLTISGIPTVSGTFNYQVDMNDSGSGTCTSIGTITVTPVVGNPSTPSPSSSTICQGSSQTSYTTSATNATDYVWSVTGTGNSISGTGTTGTVTWDPAFTGDATVSVYANGCGGPSSTESATVTVRLTPTAEISGTTTV